MSDNLGGESFNRKQKLKKLSKTTLRLRGWMNYRIQRSSKPWVHIRLQSFCNLTGKSLRTAKRCLNALREDHNDLVIRTINQDGVWKIVASTCYRLYGLSRSEPFTSAENGSKQIVKESMLGKEIKEEQLIVGKDKAFWNAKSRTHEALTEEAGLPKEDKKQMTFNFEKDSDIFPIIVDGTPNGVKVKHQFHRQSGGCSNGIKKLAFHLARKMKHSHYDNMKIQWELPFCYVFAKESLIKRANKRTILKAWDIAAHELHAEAVDQGVTEAGSWRPSSTLARARKILKEGDCFGRWFPMSQNTQKVITSAN
jgi:hypothetical protein